MGCKSLYRYNDSLRVFFPLSLFGFVRRIFLGSLGQFIVVFASILLDAVMLAFFFRAILSWLPLGEESLIESFLFSVTEPLIYPVRILFEKFNIAQNFPMDIPYFVTYMIIFVFSMIIS